MLLFFNRQWAARAHTPLFFTLVILVLAAFLLCAIAPPAHANEKNRNQSESIKAAYLFNLLKFSQWPEPSTPSAPINICLLGKETAVMRIVKQAFQGRRIKNRPLTIQQIQPINQSQPLQALAQCQVVYLGTHYSQKTLSSIQEFANEHQILTVSDQPQFAKNGGAIELKTDKQKNRITIVINMKTCRLSSINFSSKLMQLAELLPE